MRIQTAVKAIGGTAVLAGAVAGAGWWIIQQEFTARRSPGSIYGEIDSPPGTVEVSLDNGTQLVTADEIAGSFRFEQVPPGTHFIRYTHDGYRPGYAKFNVTGGSENYVALQALQPQVPTTEETTPEDASEVPSVVLVPSPHATCDAVKSIRDLGWRSGHKTKFCLARGYDGVHNPYGNYSAGGYCYRGDNNACLELIKKVS